MRKLLLIAVIALAGCTQQTQPSEIDQSLELTGNQEPQMTQETTTQDQQELITVQLNTSKGQITLALNPNNAPNTVENFVSKAGAGFYEGLTFHRVEDWVIQGGDPLGTGTGGDQQPTELSNEPFTAGSLGVARGGDIQVSNDAQFFICTEDCPWLTGQYTHFGQVLEGMDVVTSIAIGDTIESIQVVE